MFRKILVAAIIMVLSIIIWQWELVTYGIQQASGQLSIVRSAKPIEDFMKSDSFPDSLKRKINLIQEVRRFAIDSLGLKNSDNYTTLYDQKGKDILWNLSAVQRFRMESKEWWFPFLGSFSYKGFFDLDRAKAEQKILDQQGYDTRIRPVGGWSTLGWFKDPILSNMLEREEGRLADLIIHELTHATIFVKDSIEFNENLATFIGKKGAEIFLRQRYGEFSKEMNAYKQYFVDGTNFANHMLRGYYALDSLYQSYPEKYSDKEKDLLKQSLLKEIIASLDTIGYSRPDRLKRYFQNKIPNNAYFMSFKRYRAKQDLFTHEYLNTFGGDLKAFIKHYQNKHPL